MSDLEDSSNLRMFALRRAVASDAYSDGSTFSSISNSNVGSMSTNRVHFTVNAAPNQSCPMHGKHGNFQLPERPSRRESSYRHQSEDESGSRRSSSYTETSNRSFSLELGHHSHSVPRKMPKGTVERHGSFQEQQQHNKPVPRDVFKGRVDFKTILRRFDPKHEERSSGGGTSFHSRGGRSRHESEPRDDSFNPRRGTIIDSDFDFRGGQSREPIYDNPGRFRVRSSSPLGPSRYPDHYRKDLRVDINMANRVQTPDPTLRRSDSHPSSPRRCESNPMSPRRVEFGEEIVFDFNPRSVGRSSSVTSPTFDIGQKVKPILRYSLSDATTKAPNLNYEHRHKSSFEMTSNASLTIQHTNQDQTLTNHRDFGFSPNDSDSLVQIFVPQKEFNTNSFEPSEEDSDETIEDAEQSAGISRKLPPMLADWSRSQSFPPPRTSHLNEPLEKAFRKSSLPEKEASSTYEDTEDKSIAA